MDPKIALTTLPPTYVYKTLEYDLVRNQLCVNPWTGRKCNPQQASSVKFSRLELKLRFATRVHVGAPSDHWDAVTRGRPDDSTRLS